MANLWTVRHNRRKIENCNELLKQHLFVPNVTRETADRAHDRDEPTCQSKQGCMQARPGQVNARPAPRYRGFIMRERSLLATQPTLTPLCRACLNVGYHGNITIHKQLGWTRLQPDRIIAYQASVAICKKMLCTNAAYLVVVSSTVSGRFNATVASRELHWKLIYSFRFTPPHRAAELCTAVGML